MMPCLLFSRRPTSSLLRPVYVLPLLVLGLLLLAPPAFAQAGPSASATMSTVKSVVIIIVRALFAVGTIIALVRVAKGFLNGDPTSITSLFWLLGGVVLFFTWGNFFRESMGTWSAPSPATGGMGNSHLVPGVSLGAYLMAEKVLSVMLTTVVPLLVFVTVAGSIIRGFISSGQLQFDVAPILRVFFMFLVLANYQNLTPLVGNLIGSVADRIEQSRPGGLSSVTSAYSVLQKLRDQRDQAASQTGSTGTTTTQGGSGTQDTSESLFGMASSIYEKMKTFGESFSLQNLIMGFATDLVTGMVQSVMEFIQSFLIAFLYVAGPIAIAFSFVPGFGGVWKHWLQSLIGVHMWSVAFQVIGGLFFYYQASDSALAATGGMATAMAVTGIAQMKFAVACIVFIIMYLMVPSMSSMIVGSSAADGFVGSAMRMGAAVATAGAGAAVAGAGAMGAGAQAANAVASTGGGGLQQAAAFGHGMANHAGSALGRAGSSSGMSVGQAGGHLAQMFKSAPSMNGAGAATQENSDVRPAASSDAVVPATAQAPAPQAATGNSSGRTVPTMGSVAAQAAQSGGSMDFGAVPTGGKGAAVPAAVPVGATAGNAPPRLPGISS